jgi:iron complex outermembrane receptor protein
LLDTPFSVTTIPQDLIENLQTKTVTDALCFLPSVEIRDQQGFEVSRPQSRGFQGSIVQATRLDGLNIIGTTAIPAENLSGIQVLNGLAGSLYGPATPAGVFNYVLKRPTDVPFASYTQGFDSNSVFTENIDAGGRTPDGTVGYRFNVVHGQGESYVPESYADRTLASGALDFHISDRTVVETDFSHYETDNTGLPGSIVYFGKPNIELPAVVNPATPGYGQPGAGADLITNTGLVQIKHEINNDWNFEIGGLYQDAVRNLFGITNTLTDNLGNYTVTKNFTAVPHFTRRHTLHTRLASGGTRDTAGSARLEGRARRLASYDARIDDTNTGFLICIFQSSDPFEIFAALWPRRFYKRWIAGCSVPSNPTIAKIANPRAISIALLRSS